MNSLLNKHRSAAVYMALFWSLVTGSPANATCPVPNTISNGQIADASKVMENFTALGNCAVSGGGDAGTAWTAYTPTVTPGAGAFTSVSATGRYKQIGKLTFVHIK